MSMDFNSHFGEDLENMIRLKVSLGGAESTYLCLLYTSPSPRDTR